MTSTVTMTAQVYIGLAVTSHNASVTTSATFTNVTTTGNTSLHRDVSALTAPLNQSAAQSGDRTAAGSVPPPNHLMNSDYDGDRKADVAAYRPSTGEWHVLNSRADYGAGAVTQWGIKTDLPVPGDYDGDGKTDLA